MRKRWVVPDGCGPTLVICWFVGGMVAWLVTTALWNGCTRYGCGMNSTHLSTEAIVGLCLWIGPFVLVMGGALLVAAAMSLWECRPRRVTEPVTEDLRTHGDGGPAR